MRRRTKILTSLLFVAGVSVPLAFAPYQAASTVQKTEYSQQETKAMLIREDGSGQECPYAPQSTQDFYNSHPEQQLPQGWYRCGTPIWYNPRKPETPVREKVRTEDNTMTRADYIAKMNGFFPGGASRIPGWNPGEVYDGMAKYELVARENFSFTPSADGKSLAFVQVGGLHEGTTSGGNAVSAHTNPYLVSVGTSTSPRDLLSVSERIRGSSYVDQYLAVHGVDFNEKNSKLYADIDLTNGWRAALNALKEVMAEEDAREAAAKKKAAEEARAAKARGADKETVCAIVASVIGAGVSVLLESIPMVGWFFVAFSEAVVHTLVDMICNAIWK